MRGAPWGAMQHSGVVLYQYMYACLRSFHARQKLHGDHCIFCSLGAESRPGASCARIRTRTVLRIFCASLLRDLPPPAAAFMARGDFGRCWMICHQTVGAPKVCARHRRLQCGRTSGGQLGCGGVMQVRAGGQWEKERDRGSAVEVVEGRTKQPTPWASMHETAPACTQYCTRLERFGLPTWGSLGCFRSCAPLQLAARVYIVRRSEYGPQ